MSYQFIHDIVLEHMRSMHKAIDVALAVAEPLECGVKLVIHVDGSYTVSIDPDVPYRNIHEYRSSGALIGYGFDVYKRPYVEKMISSADTPGNGP